MYRFDYYFPTAFDDWDDADGTWSTAEAEAVYDEIALRALLRNIDRYSDYGPNATDFVTTCDADTNGEISDTELYNCWSAGVYPWRLAGFDAVYDDMFAYFDVDESGSLEGDEITAFQAHLSGDDSY